MSNTILNVLANSVLGRRFRNLGYLPRWIIYCLDIGIVLFAVLFTKFIVISLSVNFASVVDFPYRAAIIVAVNAIFFFIYRTYAGILRHSTFIDGVKLLISTTTSYFFLLGINFFTYFYLGRQIFLTTGLFITYLISFLLLFLFRIMVKFFFEQYVHLEDSKKLVRAVIYGADANAISVATALKTEIPSRFKLIGFIDKFNQSKVNKSMLNLRIVNQSKKVHVILRSLKAEALIIAEKSLTRAETIAIVEECLEYNFKVFTVPTIADWEDQEQISNKVKNFDIEDLLERKPIVLDTKSISGQLKKKVVLVTGAAGSIGSEITRQVIGFGPAQLILVDQAESPLHQLALEIADIRKKVKVHPILADIRNLSAVENIISTYRPEVIYHAAAYKHVPLMEDNPSQAVFTNIMGTKNLADLSIKYDVKRFVMVSTDKAVNPSNVMGASKRIAEKYVQSLQARKSPLHDTKFITTRFGNVLGSNGSVVPLFSKQIKDGGPITITHPDIIRYFMTIPEACQLVLEAGAMGNGGEIFIFDMGEPVKIIDLAKKMIRLAGFLPDKDIEIKVIGLRPGEKLYEELLNDTSKTMPTHNHKIMIAVDMEVDHKKIDAAIDDLLKCAEDFCSDKIVARMKKIVPEFKSMNSVFENLDR